MNNESKMSVTQLTILTAVNMMGSGIIMLPGFSPEIQGVYLEDTADGKKTAFGYVLKKEYEKTK